MNELYLSMRKALFRAAAKILPPQEVEDVVQEAYVRLCQVGSPSGIKNPRGYLLQTVRNLALDHIKRAEYRLSDELEEDLVSGKGLADEVYEQAASQEEFAHFCDAARRLPTQCRRVYVLKKVYGYSQREIAKELVISESTVEKHISLAARRCSEYMKNRVSQAPAFQDSKGGTRYE